MHFCRFLVSLACVVITCIMCSGRWNFRCSLTRPYLWCTPPTEGHLDLYQSCHVKLVIILWRRKWRADLRVWKWCSHAVTVTTLMAVDLAALRADVCTPEQSALLPSKGMKMFLFFLHIYFSLNATWPGQDRSSDATSQIKEDGLSLDIVCKCCAPYLRSLVLKYKDFSFNPSPLSPPVFPSSISFWKVRNKIRFLERVCVGRKIKRKRPTVESFRPRGPGPFKGNQWFTLTQLIAVDPGGSLSLTIPLFWDLQGSYRQEMDLGSLLCSHVTLFFPQMTMNVLW